MTIQGHEYETRDGVSACKRCGMVRNFGRRTACRGELPKVATRNLDVGPGFVRVRECPDCFHTRCGEDCVCNCDAARAEYDLAAAVRLLGRIETYAREDRAVTPGFTRLARALDEARGWLRDLSASRPRSIPANLDDPQSEALGRRPDQEPR